MPKKEIVKAYSTQIDKDPQFRSLPWKSRTWRAFVEVYNELSQHSVEDNFLHTVGSSKLDQKF